jgi:hypothetical protein
MVGKTPGLLTAVNQPFDTGPLIDQHGRYVHYEILINKPMFDFIVANKLYSRAGQAASRGLTSIFFRTEAPAVGNIRDEYGCQADPCIDRARGHFERPRERPLGLLAVRRRHASIPPRPASRNVVVGIRIDRLFLLDTTSNCFGELEIKLRARRLVISS